jgi:hypothetical protein
LSMNASPAPDWASLHIAIEQMASAGNAEIHEAGEWLAELSSFRWELRHEGKSPLLHLWSDERNLTRRVVGVKEQSEVRIVLEVQRFGRAKPSKFELVRPDSPRLPVRVVRERFRVALRRIIDKNFPDAKVETLTTARDLKHSFSEVYVRGGMIEARRKWAVMAVRPGESAAAVKDVLAYGVLWLDRVRERTTTHGVEGLRLIVPPGTSGTLLERLQGLSASAKTEIYELDETEGRLRKTQNSEANLDSWLIPRGERDSLLNQARAIAASIHSIALHVLPAGNEVTVRLASGGMEAALAFRGFEFARFSREGLRFGLTEPMHPLTKRNQKELDSVMFQLDFFRSPLANDQKHRLYRAAPERWIETLILADSTRLDAQLDTRHLYSQVPALTQDRGVMDLLGITRRGRLAVIEVKAKEDAQLPIQALDYWLRIRRHQVMGDLERYGYFPDCVVSTEPPLIWLVAPGLEFHPSTDILARYLLPGISVTRIGLAQSWRRGIRVIFRQQVGVGARKSEGGPAIAYKLGKAG